jgi:hypothetical protein
VWDLFQLSRDLFCWLRICAGIVFCVTWLSGCQSFILSSNPADVEVFIRDLEKSEDVRIGLSPRTISTALISRLGIREPLVVSFRKQGFVEERVVFTRIPSGGGYLARLKPISESGESMDMNQIIRFVLEGERALIEKNPKRVQEMADKIRAINPNVAAAFVLEGAALVSEGKLKEARSAFWRAVAIDPLDLGTKKTLEELDRKLGISKQPMEKQPVEKSGE